MTEDKELKAMMALMNMQGGAKCPCSCGKCYPILDARKYRRFMFFLCRVSVNSCEQLNIVIYDTEYHKTIFNPYSHGAYKRANIEQAFRDAKLSAIYFCEANENEK